MLYSKFKTYSIIDRIYFSLFEFNLVGTLLDRTKIEITGISTITKICFVDDKNLATTSTDGHLIYYEFEGGRIEEKESIFVEQNMLTALNVNEDVAFIGSVSGKISAVKLNSFHTISSQQAHASTITDIQISQGARLEIFSIGLDRCVVQSTFDGSEIRILKTIAHCIYDPSRIRILRSNEKSVFSLCVVSGYGMQSLLV